MIYLTMVLPMLYISYLLLIYVLIYLLNIYLSLYHYKPLWELILQNQGSNPNPKPAGWQRVGTSNYLKTIYLPATFIYLSICLLSLFHSQFNGMDQVHTTFTTLLSHSQPISCVLKVKHRLPHLLKYFLFLPFIH